MYGALYPKPYRTLKGTLKGTIKGTLKGTLSTICGPSGEGPCETIWLVVKMLAPFWGPYYDTAPNI